MGKFLFFLFALSSYAEFVFEQATQSIAVDPKKEKIFLTFPFTVSGDTELVKIDEHCSCAIAKITENKESWQDGEKGRIDLALDVSLIHGSSKKAVSLLFKHQEPQKLVIDLSIPLALSVKPRNQKWKVGAEPEAKEYQITIAPEFDFKIASITQSNTNFNFELRLSTVKAEKEGRVYTLSVTPKSLDKKEFCLFKLKTDSDIQRYKSISLMAITQ